MARRPASLLPLLPAQEHCLQSTPLLCLVGYHPLSPWHWQQTPLTVQIALWLNHNASIRTWVLGCSALTVTVATYAYIYSPILTFVVRFGQSSCGEPAMRHRPQYDLAWLGRHAPQLRNSSVSPFPWRLSFDCRAFLQTPAVWKALLRLEREGWLPPAFPPGALCASATRTRLHQK